jgi:hypothetical protein
MASKHSHGQGQLSRSTGGLLVVIGRGELSVRAGARIGPLLRQSGVSHHPEFQCNSDSGAATTLLCPLSGAPVTGLPSRSHVLLQSV